jgi:PBSX family phage terminase large subunit
MNRTGQTTFEFKPFSVKQKQVLTWWLPESGVNGRNGLIADGAIRSGKSLSLSLAFVFWAMESFDRRNFGMCGKTVGSFRRNVLTLLKVMLLSRGYMLEDRLTENRLVVARNGVENYFYVFGGRDERSQDLIQGVTLAGCLFDEVALMPESFVNQATARCSVDGSKWWFNCNPEGPFHWFKTGWIEQQAEKGLLYLHFDMNDNLSLSEEIKTRYRSMYAGVFYKRYIEGRWAVADGLIYDMWDEAENGFADADWTPDSAYHTRIITVDYGTTNPMAWLDVYDDGHTLWLWDEYYYSSRATQIQKTDAQYGDDMDAFTEGRQVREVILDPSAASFKVELRNRGYLVRDADNEVNDGIRMTGTMMAKRKIRAHTRCVYLRKELYAYVWDAKKAEERGKEEPLKQNDHLCDALRYYIKTKIRRWRLAE